jgi:heat-inducible transcriptional repressor
MRKSFENLTERDKQILASLIDHYVKTAEPVGSRVLANKYKLGISPATIRNTLSDLEDIGLVTQPHTSAGRIPTDLGYRVYVDLLLKPDDLTADERERIKQRLSLQFTPIEQILEQTSRILAEVTSQLGLSTSPQLDTAILTKMDIIPVAERKLLVVIAVKSGLVRTILMEVDADIRDDMVSETSRLLNERFVGLSLREIKRTISDRFKDIRLGEPKLLRIFTDSMAAVSDGVDKDSLHVEGASNIIQQPEFRDREKLNELLGALESKEPIAEMVSAASLEEGVVVTIGKEANLGNFEMCSIVTSIYKVGRSHGRIGVIGPTRMQYSKLVSIVDYTAKLLSRLLSK